MTKSKKLTILGIVLIAVGCFFAGKTYGADEEITVDNSTGIINQVTAGWYDQKITDGAYSETEVPFGKIDLSLGSIGSLDFDGAIEYITDGFDRVDYTLGTSFKFVETDLVIKSDSRKRTAIELDTYYGLPFIPFFDADLRVTLADNNRGDVFQDVNYLSSVVLSKGHHFEVFDLGLRVGGEYGRSYSMIDDYDYHRLFGRFTKGITSSVDVFGQVDILTNDSENLSSEESFYAGIVAKF